MIVYQSTKSGFRTDVRTGDIDKIIAERMQLQLRRRSSEGDREVWQHSMLYMSQILDDDGIPPDTGIAIELEIPQTSKRIDFIITGKNASNVSHAVIIELKSWKNAVITDKDGIVNTVFRGKPVDTQHPSYQAWSYAALLNDFNEAVYKNNIQLKPCAYLHNYESDEVITNEFYKVYLDRAPAFLKSDVLRLQDFIRQFVKYGDKGETIYLIDKGKIRPSKALADEVGSMLDGNPEFVMIDEQKVVYETALSLARKAAKKKKQVLIVEGGPGTGKSVVAVNLLAKMTREQKMAQYVSKNRAPRDVYASKLTGTTSKTKFNNLFKGTGSFVECAPDIFDLLIVDEAHRANARSGMFRNKGENQLKEIIRASKCAVFFLDEDQRIALADIGSRDEIVRWAEREGASVTEMKLTSQFRCNGSDGYIAWLDQLLQIRDTANTNLEEVDYDFRVCSSPAELRALIQSRNKENGKSRMVAGYCWNWASNSDPRLYDIEFPEYDFRMRWNLSVDGGLWIVKPNSIDEIGCIHTCQGLELDYVGVIIGPDMILKEGKVETDVSARAGMDSTVRGWKKLMKEDPETTKARLDKIIRNTYRTLMTRGMKGCYVYCVDTALAGYFKESLSEQKQTREGME